MQLLVDLSLDLPPYYWFSFFSNLVYPFSLLSPGLSIFYYSVFPFYQLGSFSLLLFTGYPRGYRMYISLINIYYKLELLPLPGLSKVLRALSFHLSLNCVCAQLLSHVAVFVTPQTVAHQAPLSMGLSWQEYWNGLPLPPPEDLPDPGIKSTSSAAPALQADSLPLSQLGGPQWSITQP